MPSRRLTILQVLPALDGGGVERGVIEIAAAVVAAGHRSLVVSAGGRLTSELIRSGTEHFTRSIGRKSPLTLRHVAWLRKLMVDESVDVIDIHSRLPGWMTWLAWKSLALHRRPKLITTVHGLHRPGLYSSIMCRGERVITVSHAAREYVLQHYPDVSAVSIITIPRGIDPIEFPRGLLPDHAWRTAFFAGYPAAMGKPLLTLPGRITRLKGHANFLQLLAALRSRGVTCHGLIVGEAQPRQSGYLRELQSMAAQLQLNDHVTFTGHRTDIRQIMAVSSIVLSLSNRPEAFGRTVSEALAIGTPVVGFHHGGVAEILDAQFPAGGVELGNQQQLTDRVTAILTHSEQSIPSPVIWTMQSMQDATIAAYESIAR